MRCFIKLVDIADERPAARKQVIAAESNLRPQNDYITPDKKLKHIDSTIEKSKQTIKLTEADIRKYYVQILKAEPQMLINYFVKEVVLYDDRIEIHYNSPLKTSPTDDESSDKNRGFSFYTKTVQLNNVIVILTLYIA